jgi:hypothetical protein
MFSRAGWGSVVAAATVLAALSCGGGAGTPDVPFLGTRETTPSGREDPGSTFENPGSTRENPGSGGCFPCDLTFDCTATIQMQHLDVQVTLTTENGVCIASTPDSNQTEVVQCDGTIVVQGGTNEKFVASGGGAYDVCSPASASSQAICLVCTPTQAVNPPPDAGLATPGQSGNVGDGG